MSRSLQKVACFAALIGGSAGCRMDVPIHVWQPPTLESTVGKKVVLSEVAGPKETAKLLREKMLSGVPHDAGRQTVLSPTGTLNQNEAIRLVSATDEAPSDIALRAAATQDGYDYVLRGEVLADRRPKHVKDNDERLTVSWRLMPLDQTAAGNALDDHTPTGAPVVVNRQSAVQRYPDLALLSDDESILTTAAVRDTYRLITPSIDQADVDLAIPYLMFGSAKIRQGNMAALAGRWGEAKQIWSEVAEKHPLQVAAIHNLALAAAAEQDFSTAKQLARKAIRRAPTSLHKQTAMWIEQQQREYHKSFNLPDPPEGWFLTK